MSSDKSIPPELVEIIDTERHLSNTLKRATQTACSPSMRRMLAKMVGAVARERLHRRFAILPGHRKLAKWGRCGERQVKRNLAQLQNAEVIVECGYHVGRGWKKAWSVEPGALRRWLVLIGANPSPKLFHRLDQLLTRPVVLPAAAPAMGTEKCAEKGDTEPRKSPSKRGTHKGDIKGDTRCKTSSSKPLKNQLNFFDLLSIDVAPSVAVARRKRHGGGS